MGIEENVIFHYVPTLNTKLVPTAMYRLRGTVSVSRDTKHQHMFHSALLSCYLVLDSWEARQVMSATRRIKEATGFSLL